MGFEDKSLQCCDCGATFVFTAGEQEFFQTKGYTNVPKRCTSCRSNRRTQRPNGENTTREMYPAVCATCGKETQVPFAPREGRPVYCRECYSKTKPTR